jgi:hypothetical protein
MDTIKVAVYVPLAAALNAGRAQYGEGSVELSDADVTQLSAEARALLCVRPGAEGLVGLGPRAKSVNVLAADVPSTLAAIETEAAQVVLERREEAASREARIAKALAANDEDWIGGGDEDVYYIYNSQLSTSQFGYRRGAPRVLDSPESQYLTDVERADPRIVARRATIDLAPHREAHARRYAEWLALVERTEAERTVAMVRWHELCSAYVIRWCPEYARAAQDGKDVRKLAVRNSVEASVELLNSVGLETVASHGDVEDHPCPHQRAYVVLDRVRLAMDCTVSAGIELAATGGIVTGVASRLVRVDTCPERGCTAGIRTCVELVLTYGDGSTEEIYVYADGAPRHPHARRSDEEMPVEVQS